MTQTRKNGTKDAEAKRREYLWEKARLRSNIISNRVWGLISALAVGVGIFVTVAAVIQAIFVPGPISIFAPVIPFGFTVLFGVLVRVYRQHAQKARDQEAALPYVPTAREQIAALRAEEVLVRGSEVPAARPGELLRAAHARPATPEEELLRTDCRGPADRRL